MLRTTLSTTTTSPLNASTENTTANSSSEVVDVWSQEPYFFFPSGTLFSEIDAMLWTSPEARELSDTEHLERFLELKNKAAPEHQEKFKIFIKVDISADKTIWSYSFKADREFLYEAKFQSVPGQNVPVALARYETEYLRQIFSPFSVDVDALHSAIEKFRENVSKLSTPKEKWESFAQLASMVPSGRDADMFFRSTWINSDKKTWAYAFKVGTLQIYRSDNIELGDLDLNRDVNDYGYLRQLELLHSFRALMRKADCPENIMARLVDSSIPYGARYLGTASGILQLLKKFAVYGNRAGQTPAIVIRGESYYFSLKGMHLYSGVINRGFNPCGDIPMSLISTAAFTLNDSIEPIMANLERFQYQPERIPHLSRIMGLPELPAATPMSLRAAVQNPNYRIETLVADKAYSPKGLLECYTLTASTRDGDIKVFSMSEAAPVGVQNSSSDLIYSNDTFRQDIFQALIRPLKEDVYDPLVLLLSRGEVVELHRFMHNFPFGGNGMTLGQALGVPKPEPIGSKRA